MQNVFFPMCNHGTANVYTYVFFLFSVIEVYDGFSMYHYAVGLEIFLSVMKYSGRL